MTDQRERTTREFKGLSNVRLECLDGTPMNTRATVDGVEITGLVAARFELESPSHISRLYLTIQGASMDGLAEYVTTTIYGLKHDDHTLPGTQSAPSGGDEP